MEKQNHFQESIKKESTKAKNQNTNDTEVQGLPQNYRL